MAVLDALPGIEVEILVDGEPLKEYADEGLEDDPKSVKCYIEAVTGKGFQVQLKVSKGTQITRQAMNFHTYVDGNFANGKTILARKFQDRDYAISSKGRPVGLNQVQDYCFSELEMGN